MKKIIILIAIFTVLANCEIKPRTADAQERSYSTKEKFYDNSSYFNYQYHEEERHGMKYGVWSLSMDNTSHHTGFTVAVVNLTKEELEVELLKLQIVELHNKVNKP